MTEQLSLTCTSKADLLSDLDDHFTSLGLTLPEFVFSLPSHPSGVAETTMDDGTRVLISVQESKTPLLAADFIIEGPNASKWKDIFHVPLTFTDTTIINATRGDLEVPATNRGTGTVRPVTPSHVISGITPLPPIEGEDYESPPEWVQPTGAHDVYSLGALTTHSLKVWTSLVDANVWEPGVSAWREATSGEIPEWVQPTGAHDAYQLNDQVTHNGSVWTSTVDNNVWEPGVFGWIEEGS